MNIPALLTLSAAIAIGAPATAGGSGNVTISDATGMFEVMIFSEVLAASRDLLTVNTPLLLTVEARLEEARNEARSLSKERISSWLIST